jgi:hypothetical protein
MIFGTAIVLWAAALAQNPVDVVKDDVVRAMNAKDAAKLFSMFSGPMKSALPTEKVTAFISGVIDSRGKITGATVIVPGKNKASYRLSAERGEWQLDLTIDDSRQILGFSVRDPPPPDPPVVKSAIPLVLPFKERWFVVHGGDTVDVNQHVSHKSQRRAADLIIRDQTGKSFKTDGKKNEDYYAYKKEIRAVAPGKVVVAIDGVPDNEPGSMNPYFTMGNSIIIEHAPNLYSEYSHFTAGSVRVKVGDAVKAGQVIGLCGNSGNSSEPHLHFQLQDGKKFEASFGVEAVFDRVKRTRDGKTEEVRGYTFLRGDEIEP